MITCTACPRLLFNRSSGIVWFHHCVRHLGWRNHWEGFHNASVVLTMSCPIFYLADGIMFPRFGMRDAWKDHLIWIHLFSQFFERGIACKLKSNAATAFTPNHHAGRIPIRSRPTFSEGQTIVHMGLVKQKNIRNWKCMKMLWVSCDLDIPHALWRSRVCPFQHQCRHQGNGKAGSLANLVVS